MNRKACSGDPGHPAQPCCAQPGFAVRLEEAACTLWGYSFGQAWGGSFQLFVVPLLLAATGHGKEYPPPFFFLWSVLGRYGLLVQLGPVIAPQIPVHCQGQSSHRTDTGASWRAPHPPQRSGQKLDPRATGEEEWVSCPTPLPSASVKCWPLLLA